MKNQILKASVFSSIIILIFTSCGKDSINNGPGLGNENNLALTTENINGTWKATGNTKNNFISFSFSNGDSYSIIKSDQSESNGSYSIDNATNLVLDENDTISLTLLSDSIFYF